MAAALQAAFHLALARILLPSGYSLLATMLTLVLIATPAALAVQRAVAAEVSWRLAREGTAAAGLVLRDTLSSLSRRLLALFALFVPLGIVVALLTDVRHPLPVLATIATVAALPVLAIGFGGLEGTGRLRALSGAQCLFAGLKLGAGVALGLLGAAAGGVMLGVAAAAWTAAAVAALPLRRLWREGRELRSRPRRMLRGFAGGPALVLTLLAALTSMGVLVARLSFDQHTSGGYAAISFGAYSLLAVVLTLTTLLFPPGAGVRGRGGDRLHPVGGILAIAVLGAIGTACLFAFPETLLRLTFGPHYLFAAPWLGPLGIAMTLFAIGDLHIYRLLSAGNSQYVLPLCALLAAEIVLFALFHSSPEQLIDVLIATAAVLLAGGALFERAARESGQAPEGPEGEAFVPLRAVEPLRDLAGSGEEVTVVIPAYEEAAGIESTLRGTAACMEEFRCPFELLVVDDGSRDATRAIAERVATEMDRVRVIGYERNAGKGHAVVQGARAASGALVLFLDADLEVHPRQLRTLYAAMQEAGADVVIGSKVHADSSVDYPRKRRAMSWGYYAIVRLFFGLPVRDTQTGLKLFRREVLDGVVPRMLVKRFAFDLEALVIAHRLGYRVIEAPVTVTRERELSTVGWADALHTAWDTAAVWYRAYLRRYYDWAPPRAPGDAEGAPGESGPGFRR